MDVNTGHLVSGVGYQNLYQHLMNDVPEHLQAIIDGYKQVPKELERAAELKLAGCDEAMVSLTSGGKLSRWAAQERAKERCNRRDKHKRQIQKESRRRNRG